MGSTGYVDWHRITRGPFIGDLRAGLQTSVFAFWTVDYGRSTRDRGVTLLKAEGGHPDWFIHADRADHVLAAYAHPQSMVNAGFMQVFDTLQSKPLLGSLLLGTSNLYYKHIGRDDPDAAWFASRDDLTRAGRKLLARVDDLYLRPATIVTFIDPRPMSQADPGAQEDQATVD